MTDSRAWVDLDAFDDDRDGPRAVPDPPILMTPGEVAVILHVDANTLARWADLGKIQAVRTPGGHRRYVAAEVHELARRGFRAP